MRVIVLLLLCCLPLLMNATPLQAAGTWERSGLEWHPTPPPPTGGAIDAARVAAQIAQGCVDGRVRFGNSADMRDTLGSITWPDHIRRLLSVAAMTDSHAEAQLAIDEALSDSELGSLQSEVLKNQKILMALQFGDEKAAAGLLDAYGYSSDVPPPLLSDRLFWGVLVDLDRATAPNWKTVLEPRLDLAIDADPTSFQVRVYRVISWLSAESWRDGGSCLKLIEQFSNRVLDVSEENACPLMIGHFSHIFDRHFQRREAERPASSAASWQAFAIGLLAFVGGEQQTVKTISEYLSGLKSSVGCASEMALELNRLELP